MKKTLVIIILIFIVVMAVLINMLMNNNRISNEARRFNLQYESYLEREILRT